MVIANRQTLAQALETSPQRIKCQPNPDQIDVFKPFSASLFSKEQLHHQLGYTNSND